MKEKFTSGERVWSLGVESSSISRFLKRSFTRASKITKETFLHFLSGVSLAANVGNYKGVHNITMRKVGKGKVVAVSGGFDPIHIGHVRMLQEAKKLGTHLVVIVNNDNWLRDKKGFVFMDEKERVEVIRAIKGVDEVVLTKHKKGDEDRSVKNALADIDPHIFANGGDRTNKNTPEDQVCDALNIKMVFGIGKGGKVQSSSWLTEGRKTIIRPWGEMDVLRDRKSYWIKELRIKKGGKLSLQKHNHRAENWVVIAGEAIAEIGGKKKVMRKGDMVAFKKGEVHRMSSKNGATFIEVAFGKMSEDDIVRFEDEYGRV